MHTDEGRKRLSTDGLTESIIGCAFAVQNALGSGFLERVYENALALGLRKSGHSVQQQFSVAVRYRGEVVGDYFVDLLVNEIVLIELKACRALDPIHFAQVLNYLKATSLPVGLLMNFGTPRLEFKRILP